MKRLIVLSLFCLFLLSCKQDKISEVKPKNMSSLSLERDALEESIKPKGKIKFYLHRGKKWSARHGYPTCTHSSGICSVRLGVSLRQNSQDTTIVSNDGSYWTEVSEIFANPSSNTGYSQKITFKENIPHKEEYFMSYDDDEFVYPTELSKELFGRDSLTIVPKPYLYMQNNKNPFGYLIVDVR